MDDGRIGGEMTLEGLAKQLAEMRSEIKGDIKALDHKMTIEFEETRRLINLGFENVQMLDEKVDRRFDEADRVHADHKSLIEAALIDLRHDMKRPRRPGGRR
jgi:hypothetical protein